MKNGGAKMIESWKVDSNKLMKKMNVTEKGLSDEQVLQIREKVGENLLEEAKKKSVLQVFLSQFCDLLVIILIIAAVLLSLPLVLSAAFCVEERWGFLSRKHDKCIDEHYR